MAFSVDPGSVVVLVLAVVLYVQAIGRLRRRGQQVGRWQQACWYGGVGVAALGLVGPIDGLADGLLSAHMAQHLLIADLSAPLLLAGIRMPVLVFMLPAPGLRRLARLRRLRRVLAFLRQPLAAIAAYAVLLYGWHFSFMFEAALAHPVVHALQHESFVLGSVLVWWAALEPGRRRLQGELWKAAHIVGARLVGMFLGMGFIALRTPVYTAGYGTGPRTFGLSPLTDQQIAGGLMLSLDLVIMLGGLAYFFWRAGEEHDRMERTARAGGPLAAGDG